MPAIKKLIWNARETRANTDKETIRAALVNYLGEYGSWPCLPAQAGGRYIIDDNNGDPWTNVFLFGNHDELIREYLDRDATHNPKKVHYGNWTEYDWNAAGTHMISPFTGNPYSIVVDFEKMDARVVDNLVPAP